MKYENCEQCSGSGRSAASQEGPVQECFLCGGSGKVPVVYHHIPRCPVSPCLCEQIIVADLMGPPFPHPKGMKKP